MHHFALSVQKICSEESISSWLWSTRYDLAAMKTKFKYLTFFLMKLKHRLIQENQQNILALPVSVSLVPANLIIVFQPAFFIRWVIAGLKLHLQPHSGKYLPLLSIHNESCLLFHVRNAAAINMGRADVFRRAWGPVE